MYQFYVSNLGSLISTHNPKIQRKLELTNIFLFALKVVYRAPATIPQDSRPDL